MIIEITEIDLENLDFEEVESSQIHAVAWADVEAATLLGWNAVDPATESYWEEGTRQTDTSFLVVEFKPGKNGRSIYAYRGVDQEGYEELRDAPSAGRHLHASVKPAHPFLKIRVVDEYTDQSETPA